MNGEADFNIALRQSFPLAVQTPVQWISTLNVFPFPSSVAPQAPTSTRRNCNEEQLILSGDSVEMEDIQGQQADGLRSQKAGQLVVPASSSQMNQAPFNNQQKMKKFIPLYRHDLDMASSSSSSSRSIHRAFSPLLPIEPSSDIFLDSDIQSSV